MIKQSIKDIISEENSNSIISKKIDIDELTSAFVFIKANDKKIIHPVLNKMIDFILDNVSGKDIYDGFLNVLESGNAFLKTLEEEQISIFIGIIENNKLHFSKFGDISCYLINSKSEFIKLTDNSENTYFDDVSSGVLYNEEKIIISSCRLLDYITKTDALEISELNDIDIISDTIISYLKKENIEKNCKIMTIQYENELYIKKEVNNSEKFKYFFYKACDNFLIKKIFAYFLFFRDYLNKKSKHVKNIVFFTGIIFSTLFLFLIISSLVGRGIETNKKTEARTALIEARDYLMLATQNMDNKEAFMLNINSASDLVDGVKAENLFLNDVQLINSEISTVKKQFNGIQGIDLTTDNLVFAGDFSDGIKLLEINKKQFVVTKNSILGPILPGQKIKESVFELMDLNDYFIDAGISGSNIILSTKNNRLVKFTSNGDFSYVNVIGQEHWGDFSELDFYNGNIYLVNEDGNQIFKHSPSIGDFNAGKSYLKDEDSKNINILDIAIDGGFYILKKDLSLIKFFSSPYRMEGIMLNNLPTNYSIEEGNENIVKISTFNNSNFVYIFLNGRILIFSPNTKNYKDTRYLNYLGQLEINEDEILSFYSPRDSEINVLTKTGIYKLTTSIVDDKIFITK